MALKLALALTAAALKALGVPRDSVETDSPGLGVAVTPPASPKGAVPSSLGSNKIKDDACRYNISRVLP